MASSLVAWDRIELNEKGLIFGWDWSNYLEFWYRGVEDVSGFLGISISVFDDRGKITLLLFYKLHK